MMFFVCPGPMGSKEHLCQGEERMGRVNSPEIPLDPGKGDQVERTLGEKTGIKFFSL